MFQTGYLIVNMNCCIQFVDSQTQHKRNELVMPIEFATFRRHLIRTAFSVTHDLHFQVFWLSDLSFETDSLFSFTSMYQKQ